MINKVDAHANIKIPFHRESIFWYRRSYESLFRGLEWSEPSCFLGGQYTSYPFYVHATVYVYARV